MANKEHLDKLKEGVEEWNRRRKETLYLRTSAGRTSCAATRIHDRGVFPASVRVRYRSESGPYFPQTGHGGLSDLWEASASFTASFKA